MITVWPEGCCGGSQWWDGYEGDRGKAGWMV